MRHLVLYDQEVPADDRSVPIRAASPTEPQRRATCTPQSAPVNLSARSLLDPDLVPDVAALLGLHRVPAGLLTLEITEGSVISDLHRTSAVLQQLADLGVRLSVDDFGTGYSSLSYLSRLPVHEVKVDKHFVTTMVADEHFRRLCVPARASCRVPLASPPL